MGFYGNVTSSNKTAFTFDITYHSRVEMDAACNTDGVFIGRYVLISYDEKPISAYRSAIPGPYEGYFYSGPGFTEQSRLNPRKGAIYLDLTQAQSDSPFYFWNGTAYEKMSSDATTYSQYYHDDVITYGRGYDSTAWRKSYDVETNTYKYVMISELNTIVPNFHLIADPPSNVPTAPYFDRDTTTNIDYFLHDQAAWGHSIRQANSEEKKRSGENKKDFIDGDYSDEVISRMESSWQRDDYGNQSVTDVFKYDVAGDIYYNKAGFNKKLRTLSPRDESGDKSAITDTINYDLDHSGRLYFDYMRTDGVWQNGATKNDMMEWYIHLPILGDAICELWDDLYSYDKEDFHRFIKVSNARGEVDKDNNEITYNTTSAIGAINTMRDLFGYILINLEDNNSTIKAIVDNSDLDADQRAAALKEEIAKLPYSYSSTDTQYLYYTRLSGTNPDQDVKEHYYAYTYDPQYEEVQLDTETGLWYYEVSNPETGESEKRTFPADKLYYYNADDKIYRRVNKFNVNLTLSNGVEVPAYAHLFAPRNRWKMNELACPKEDSVYGLMLRMHELIGDNNPTLRSFDTLNGLINILDDMVGNLSTQLQAHRLVMTNVDGQIVDMLEYEKDGGFTGKTVEYPYFASADNQELLDCGGHWRLPVTYKLETLSLTDDEDKYFNKYWGNSEYHEITATDTIGEALTKISEELSDLQYYRIKRIKDFGVTVGYDKEYFVTGGNIAFYAQINRGTPWQECYFTINNSTEKINLFTIDSNSAYLNDHSYQLLSISSVSGYSSYAEALYDVMQGTEDFKVTIHVIDERGNDEKQSITIKHCLTHNYTITDATTDIVLDNSVWLKDGIIKFDATLGEKEYLYLQVPNADYRLFINNMYGGFDLYDAEKHIYRTTNHSLGKIEVEIYE